MFKEITFFFQRGIYLLQFLSLLLWLLNLQKNLRNHKAKETQQVRKSCRRKAYTSEFKHVKPLLVCVISEVLKLNTGKLDLNRKHTTELKH
jgi:hypothetical protein